MNPRSIIPGKGWRPRLGAAALVACLGAGAWLYCARIPAWPLRLRLATSAVDLAFSPDGRTLATANHKSSIQLWDLSTGDLRKTLPVGPAGQDVIHLSYREDGKALVLAWRANRRPGSAEFPPCGVQLLDSVTGKVLVAARIPDGTFSWSISAGSARESLVLGWLAGLPNAGFALKLTRFDPETLEIRGAALVPLGGSVNDSRLALSPDGRWLAMQPGERGTVAVWDVPSGRERARRAFPENYAAPCAFSPDGKTLMLIGFQSWAVPEYGTLYLWEPASGRLRTLPTDGVRFRAEFSPDGRLLATIDCMRGLRRPQDPGEWARAWRSGRPMPAKIPYSAPPDILVWDVATGRLAARLPGHLDSICCLKFSPDGTMLASAGDHGVVLIWDVPQEFRRTGK